MALSPVHADDGFGEGMDFPYSMQFHPHRTHNDRFRNLHRYHRGYAKCHKPRFEIDLGSFHTCTEPCFHLFLTAKVSGWLKASPLERRVRPEGQKGAPNLEDGRNPRKGAGPPKRRSAARLIASSACCTSARGQKGLKPTKRTQAKPGRAPKPPRRNLGERRSAGVNGGLHKAEYEGTNGQSKPPAEGGSA